MNVKRRRPSPVGGRISLMMYRSRMLGRNRAKGVTGAS
jgi:hypothetical protein